MCTFLKTMDHACMANQDPVSCMNCFILPESVREARARAFAQKHPATVTEQLLPERKAKQPGIVAYNDQMGVDS